MQKPQIIQHKASQHLLIMLCPQTQHKTFVRIIRMRQQTGLKSLFAKPTWTLSYVGDLNVIGI